MTALPREHSQLTAVPLAQPEVTLGLITYRQERFVREAVRSVLAQTYEPLEIVICDDASPDKTFTYAADEIQSYKGPHTVRLYRNERNLGIGNNNRLMELATGDLIVIAHGDDISMPDRVAKIVEAWRSSGASMITSNSLLIDESGVARAMALPPGTNPLNSLEEIARRGCGVSLLGSVLAWERDVFDVFGPLDQDKSALNTDWILPFRAAALKGIHYVDSPLVQVRQHRDQKNRRYINDQDPLVNLENHGASGLVQCLYMLDTLGTVNAKSLLPSERTNRVQKILIRTILKRAMHWRTLRNRLFASGLRPRWVPVGQGSPEIAAAAGNSDVAAATGNTEAGGDYIEKFISVNR